MSSPNVGNQLDSLLNKYPTKIPIIMESKSDFIKLKKHKILASGSIRVGTFTKMIRDYADGLNKYQAIFIFFDNVLVSNSMTLKEVYDRHKEDDDVLYVKIGVENTFG